MSATPQRLPSTAFLLLGVVFEQGLPPAHRDRVAALASSGVATRRECPPREREGRSLTRRAAAGMSLQTTASACLLVLAACAPVASVQTVAPEHAAAALATVRGRFAETGDAFVLLPATAEDGSVLQQVAAFEEAVVPALIECLADTSPSLVEHDGMPASLGAVCQWALISTNYVQDRIQRGSDNNPASAGWVDYHAIDARQQRHARSAWRAWLERQRQRERRRA